MKKITQSGITFLYILMIAGLTFAQRGRQPNDAEACAACGTCGAGAGAAIVIPIVIIVALIALNIALLVWVARDAKARGLDNSVLWMALVFFTGLIGFLIYYFSRPQGELVQCPHCGNKRLQTSAKCPTCGNQ